MNYELNSFVNRKEAEALKELIFKRARERANTMTDDVQADIMNIARESFVSSKNPFSQILTQTEELKQSNVKEKVEEPTVKESALHTYTDAVEAMSDDVNIQPKIYTRAINQNKMIKEQLTAAQVQNTMMEAREGLSNNKSFMGALSFLNSQAAVSLLNKRAGHGIDMVV